MNDIQFVKPTMDMVTSIAANMRQPDVDEVWASHRYKPLQAIIEGWKISQRSVVVMVNGIPCVILGLVVRDFLSGIGVPWLLGTEQSLKHSREFLKLSPPVIDEMLALCPVLFNYVHVDNRVSIIWLKWLGFNIEEPAPRGVNNELFHKFHLERVEHV